MTMLKDIFYIIIITIVILLALGLGILYRMNVVASTPKYMSQSCEYKLTIETNYVVPKDIENNPSRYPIRNFTLIIPLPHRNERPLLLDNELTPEVFINKSVEEIRVNWTSPPLKISPQVNYTFIVRNGTQMVMIQSDSSATISDFTMRHKETRDLEDGTPVEELQETMNTRTPLRNSTVFAPYDGCIPASAPSCSYTVPVFVSYDADANATVKITSYLKCGNDWAEPFRWVGNAYWDIFSLEKKGPTQGWYPARGGIQAGYGIYEVGGHI